MNKTYREENGEFIIGYTIPVFIVNGGYHLAELMVYKDGMIDCWGLVNFDAFVEKVKSGWIAMSVPKGEKVFAYPLGNFISQEFVPRSTSNDLILEVDDAIAKLNGREDSRTACFNAFNTYIAKPDLVNLANLRLTFYRVPEPNRRYILGDIDVDDAPIIAILEGDSVFENHYKGMLNKEYILKAYLKGIAIKKTKT
jgi:hypothetical protein